MILKGIFKRENQFGRAKTRFWPILTVSIGIV